MDNITLISDTPNSNTPTKENTSFDAEFASVYQVLNISARLKCFAEDFIVEEKISIDFSGEGEHCWLYIKKRACNTDWVAQQLAQYCGVKKLAVSYAGLKDRHAMTSQWFSVQLPGKPTPDWAEFESLFLKGESDDENSESVQVLQCFRHNKKLQRGALKGNLFKITLRELSDTSDECFNQLIQRCIQISKTGIPNYFGPQRFGRNRNNLQQAEKLFSRPTSRLSKQKRGLYFSAARSWLFNCILSARINDDVWNTGLPGDVYMLDGKSACFKGGEAEDELIQRLEHNEIHPTAILWGEGDVMVEARAAELESSIIDQYPLFRDGLIASRIKAHRRACRVIPGRLEGLRQGDNFVVSFSLPAGSYATMVLAEIFTELSESR